MMKKILVALLLLSMLLLLLLAWKYSGDSYLEEKMRDTYGEMTTVSTTETQTAPPETTEVPVTAEMPVTTAATVEVPPEQVEADTVLLFGGDVNLDAALGPWQVYTEAGRDLAACIDASLVEQMRSAHIFMVGNVFAFTDVTQGLDKRYTFRTVPENVEIYRKMGVDIVSLANNHVYDFGAVGLTDTLQTLNVAGIVNVGAGENLAEASRARFANFNGLRIAYTAAMRSEKYVHTPEATETSSGVMKMYDLAAYTDTVAKAAADSDFVIAYVHWGTENSLALEQEQIDGAHALIDAGADIVIGSHTHTLQPVEFYNGKPIFYSIGNLWSDLQSTESALVRVTLGADKTVKSIELVPCETAEGKTTAASAVLRDAIFARLNESASASVSSDGIVTEKK